MTGRRFNGDSGAIMVEFALFGPFLALAAMGILEFGVFYSDSQTVATAVRASTRAAANTTGEGGDSPLADWVALRAAVAGSESLDLDQIDRLVIYDADAATSADGAIPPTCKTKSISAVNDVDGVAGVCTIYSSEWLTDTFDGSDFASSGFNTTTGCPTPLTISNAWCPADRDATAPGFGTVGIYIQITRDTISGFFGDSLTIRNDAAYRIEPEAGT